MKNSEFQLPNSLTRQTGSVMHKFLLAVSFVCLLAKPSEAEIIGLGDLPGGSFGSSAVGVSDNGSFVVGSSDGTDGGEAFLWTDGGGMIGLGNLPGAFYGSIASGTSADGSVVVGRGSNPNGYEAFVWTANGGMVGLGFLPGDTGSEGRAGVSADGSTMAGASWNDDRAEAYRWTQVGGMVGIGDLPGGSFSSDARAISADGSVIVGRGDSASGSEAYRWTEAGGMIGLGDLPGGSFDSRANAVSADGSIVVGRSNGTNGNEAFLWTESGGMVGLGGLPSATSTGANAVSADGSIVVGTSSGEAFLWTETGGMVSLYDFLSAQGDDLSHWTSLIEARGVSADGRTIVGRGINAQGDNEAFVATLFSAPGVEVYPDSFTVTRGDYVSGGTVELAESDNMDFSLRRRQADTQSRTEFEIKSTSPTATPSSFEFTLEGAVFARSNVIQTIELFDYVANDWVLISTSNAARSPNPDSVVTASGTGDLSRFVEAGTMCIETRIHFQSDSPRQRFASNTDQTAWTIGQ